MCIIAIKNLKLSVYLGVYHKEQLNFKEVSVNILLKFLSMPRDCIQDKFKDIICYNALNKILKEETENKRYRLIEHLAYSLISKVKKELNTPADIILNIDKKSPIDNVDLVTFSIEEKWLA